MSFFEELKRRNVFRVGIAYAVSAWVLLQVADLVLDNVEAPGWVMDVFMLVVALGFVVALVIAWAYELTPEGIKKESDINREQSITNETGKKLNLITLIAVIVLLAFMVMDRFVLERGAPEPIIEPLPDPVAKVVPAPVELELEPSTEISAKSIAVLPLANRSINAEDAFFAEGIHDEILTRLSRVADLKVISRTSVMGYANTTKKMAEIGRELAVATLLEGGVQRAGNRVRINVQLIEAETDKHLWAEVYDRELTTDNLFDIQSEITRSISDALQAVLTGEEELALADKPTDNVEAYAYYLRAKALAAGYGRTEEQINHSISIYQSALNLDPRFAAAWAALAIDWTEMHWVTAGITGEREKAEAALANARELAPDAAETLIAEGYLHYWGYLDYQNALNALEAALEKKPGSVLALRGMAYTLRRMGRLDQAVSRFRRAIDLDPNDPGMPADLAYTLLRKGEVGEADMLHRRAIAQAPDNHWTRWSYAGYLQTIGELDRAEALLADTKGIEPTYYLAFKSYQARIQGNREKLENVLALWQKENDPLGLAQLERALFLFTKGELDSYREQLRPLEQGLLAAAEQSPDPDIPLSSLVQLYGLLGDRQKLEATIERFETELKPDALRIVEDFSRPYAWTLIGDKDRTLKYAEQLVDQFGIWEFAYFVQDPVFDSLRGEPRYKELALRYDRWLESVK